MKFGIYSIRDCVAGVYMPPSYARNDEEMIRAVRYELLKPGMMKEYSEDYTVAKIGEFDDKTGEIIACNPSIIAHLSDLAGV